MNSASTRISKPVTSHGEAATSHVRFSSTRCGYTFFFFLFGGGVWEKANSANVREHLAHWCDVRGNSITRIRFAVLIWKGQPARFYGTSRLGPKCTAKGGTRFSHVCFASHVSSYTNVVALHVLIRSTCQKLSLLTFRCCQYTILLLLLI